MIVDEAKEITKCPATGRLTADIFLSLFPFFQVLKTFVEKRNLTVEGSITWLSHQVCDDMFIYSKVII